jgi:hypothetical protein
MTKVSTAQYRTALANLVAALDRMYGKTNLSYNVALARDQAKALLGKTAETRDPADESK